MKWQASSADNLGEEHTNCLGLAEAKLPEDVLRITLQLHIHTGSNYCFLSWHGTKEHKWATPSSLRGFRIIAAMIVVSELGDIHRFAHPRQLMAYVGLVGQEDSSGERKRLGSITKAGNSHLRWIFNECAQHYRLNPGVSETLSRRQEDIDKKVRKEVCAISWKCQQRLFTKSTKLSARRKMRQKVQIALARELCGFVWAVLKVATPVGVATAATAN